PVPEALKKFGVKPNQFLVGYYPDQIGVDRAGSVRLAATTFLEDAFSRPPLTRPSSPRVSGPPIFPSSIRHDFAVGIHTAAINRAITVGYEAGLFSNIKLTDKSSISLFLPPKVEIDSRVPPSLIRVQLAIQRANGGFLESLFINKDIKLTFTGYLKVIRNPDSSFSLALNTVDPDSLQVDQNSARLPILLPLIKAKVLQLLRDFNGKLKEKPLMLAAQLKPTEEMLGLRWKLVKLETEPSTGFITAYFEFIR
ncbi:MAG: hypothetical protein KGQ59_05160, partial [Bdellovibrionales bacterium]|nr:hypothetical protein [Bdellovibrionales bacterium]